MGCFLVMTQNDFNMVNMMNKASKENNPAFEKVQFISKVNNPQTQQQEILIKVDKQLSNTLQTHFGARKSKGQQSHHIFPQKHRDFFRKIDIPIDEYAVLLDQTTHLQMHKNREGYNRAWNQFVEGHKVGNPSQMKQDAITYAGQLITHFGFGDADIGQHRKHSY